MTSEPTSLVDPALALARRCAAAMWADDQASRRLGMQLLDVAPGRSTLSMTVRDDMVNGHGSCHGGFIAALADSAFAFACNTYDDVTVAAGFDITFVAPARLGDELVADAVERSRFGRSGLYDVTVSCRRGSRDHGHRRIPRPQPIPWPPAPPTRGVDPTDRPQQHVDRSTS